MTAKEALNLYKSRDTSEKLFRGDKSYLGDRSLRIYGDTAADSKIFIEFLALIVRNRMYHWLSTTQRKSVNYWKEKDKKWQEEENLVLQQEDWNSR